VAAGWVFVPRLSRREGAITSALRPLRCSAPGAEIARCLHRSYSLASEAAGTVSMLAASMT
jgi:hypothetical protein